LIILAILFLQFSAWRIIISMAIGTVYFFSGCLLHLRQKTLHFSIVLEYFVISLLGISILIFLSLRA
jgi:hypothetical protein